jgi:hypothetical protein
MSTTAKRRLYRRWAAEATRAAGMALQIMGRGCGGRGWE